MKNPNFPIFDTRKHYQFCKMSQKKTKKWGENTTFLLNHIFSHTFHILFDTTYGILLYKQGV